MFFITQKFCMRITNAKRKKKKRCSILYNIYVLYKHHFKTHPHIFTVAPTSAYPISKVITCQGSKISSRVSTHAISSPNNCFFQLSLYKKVCSLVIPFLLLPSVNIFSAPLTFRFLHFYFALISVYVFVYSCLLLYIIIYII